MLSWTVSEQKLYASLQQIFTCQLPFLMTKALKETKNNTISTIHVLHKYLFFKITIKNPYSLT